MHSTGFLAYTISASDLPDGFPLKLDTKTFGGIIPGLKEKYPNNRPMKLAVETTEAP